MGTNGVVLEKTGLQLETIKPKTTNQKKVFDAFQSGKHLWLHGYAGTGKSFISLYLALQEVLANKYKQFTIVRSAVPTREIGYVPGDEEEKLKAYELPYENMCGELFGRSDAYDILKHKRLVQFISTSFIRGTTLHDQIVLVDESENLSFHELDSIITRLGDNSRIVFCGDFQQSDLKHKEKDGIIQFTKIIDNIKSFEKIEFQIEDIVRSGLIREYIIAKTAQQSAVD